MTRYEYIRIQFDFGDLSQLNRLSEKGWRVVSTIASEEPYDVWALLERAVMGEKA